MAWLLSPLGAAYGALTAARMAQPGARVGAPVICVGNLVVGGAGKTPTAIALALLLQARGFRPAFLSRGYGRTRSTGHDEVIRVDPAAHDFRAVGDEPLLLAAVAPTFVSADRRAAARAATASGADLLIMDDGLQNPALQKDWSVAAVDGGAGLGNGLCVPAGPLRAPAERQWPAVSALCVIGRGEAGQALAARAAAAGKPVILARLLPDPAAVDALRGARLIAFAGIGRPEKFLATLRDARLDVLEMRGYPDHHAFTAAELASMRRDAEAAGAVLVTTEKDRMRLPENFPARSVPVTLAFEEAETVATALLDAIGSLRSASTR